MIDARTLTLGHGGRWYGPYGTMACPVCQSDRRRDQDALTVADGRAGLLLHCKRLGCPFHDIATAMGLMRGDYRPPDPAIIAAREAERLADLAKRARVARRLWHEAQPIGGTLAESYLRRRGHHLPLARNAALPSSLLGTGNATTSCRTLSGDVGTGGRLRRLRDPSHLAFPRWRQSQANAGRNCWRRCEALWRR